MALTAMICPQCGANIEIDKDKEHGFCLYCGVKIKFNDTIHVIHSGTVKLEDDNSLDRLVNKCETYTKLSDYQHLRISSEKLIERFPDEIMGYVYKCAAITQGYTYYIESTEFINELQKNADTISILAEGYDNCEEYYNIYDGIEAYLTENHNKFVEELVNNQIAQIDNEILRLLEVRKKYIVQLLIIGVILLAVNSIFIASSVMTPKNSDVLVISISGFLSIFILMRPIIEIISTGNDIRRHQRKKNSIIEQIRV